ncbi:glycosyltransferase [Erysipelothrix sp. HDW6C]|uniref:glycosyltransferase n=1 Tax=Erysipelothrix sp. HDW6C TaxID=2714930 RepID=UPI0014097951|nr:glycosyltransferase [Erysipelothrix sp. HDW6C]QIK70044.1 glycosyltransferase [Erysipelothrix sp. HDW6C]
MKVLFINSVVDFGSTGKIVRSLADGLKEQGHEVLIAYGRHSKEPSHDTFYIGDKPSMAYHMLMSHFFGRHGLHSTKATKRLIDKIKEFKPDIIHLHNVHGYYLNVKMLLEYLATTDIRVLWTLHDAWTISGSSAYFDFHGCKVWEDGCVECNSTKDYPASLFIKRQRKNFAWKKKTISQLKNVTFITPSKWLKELGETSFLRQFPIEVVYNGIDVETFNSDNNKKREPKVLLGVANKWETRKGLEDFISLSERISEDYQIILIGLSKEQIARLPQNITGIERTANVQELVGYYASAYAFINPTYEDNYPTTNLEALACGTPVIAYDTGGNNEISNEHVIIVKQGCIDGIIDALPAIEEIDMTTFDVNSISAHTFLMNMMSFYKI